MLTPAGCKQQAAKQPKPMMLKAKAKNFLTTLNFKNNENNKNEPYEHSRKTQQG